MKDVPDGAQNFWEFLVESLYDFLEEIVGADLIKKTFWFFATIFIFIFFTNWFGLLPGRGHHRWGPCDTGTAFESHPPVVARRQRGPEHDLRHGADFHGAVAYLGAAIQWHLGFHPPHLRPQGRQPGISSNTS
jgi:hypothetical protein